MCGVSALTFQGSYSGLGLMESRVVFVLCCLPLQVPWVACPRVEAIVTALASKRTHTHMHKRRCTHTHTHMHTHIDKYTNTHMHLHKHTHTHTYLFNKPLAERWPNPLPSVHPTVNPHRLPVGPPSLPQLRRHSTQVSARGQRSCSEVMLKVQL